MWWVKDIIYVREHCLLLITSYNAVQNIGFKTVFNREWDLKALKCIMQKYKHCKLKRIKAMGVNQCLFLPVTQQHWLQIVIRHSITICWFIQVLIYNVVLCKKLRLLDYIVTRVHYLYVIFMNGPGI